MSAVAAAATRASCLQQRPRLPTESRSRRRRLLQLNDVRGKNECKERVAKLKVQE